MEFGGDKGAIITGASRLISAGLVEAYRTHARRVIANSRTITESTHPEVVTVAGDIADPGTAERILTDASTRALYLEAAMFMAGEVLHIDGGQSAGH